jgi:hypothetical protein
MEKQKWEIKFLDLLKDNYIYLIFFVVSVVQGLRFYKINIDDAYIFYRYIHNIISGHGWVFNIGERINATTSPLNVIVISIVAFFIKDVPTAAHLIQILFLFFALCFIYLLFKKFNMSMAGIICALILATDTTLMYLWGMETIMYCFFFIASIYFFVASRYNLSALNVALLILTRPDGIILAAILFLLYIWETKRFPLIPSVILTAVLLPWLIFSFFYFGHILPHTLGAKVSQGSSGVFGDKFIFFKGMINLFKDYFILKAIIIFSFVIVLIIGLIDLVKYKFYFYKNNKVFIILFIWVILYTGGYTILNVPHYLWYYVPIFFSIVILFIFLIYYLTRETVLKKYEKAIIVVNIVLLALVFINIYKNNNKFIIDSDTREKAYKEVGVWLKDNVDDFSTIAMTEVGTIGYYSDKKILDLTGLISKDVLPFLRRDISRENVIKYFWPEYILLRTKNNDLPSFFEPFINNYIIKENYSIVKVFRFDNFYKMTLLHIKNKIDNFDIIDLYDIHHTSIVSNIDKKKRFLYSFLYNGAINDTVRQCIVNIPPSKISYTLEMNLPAAS